MPSPHDESLQGVFGTFSPLRLHMTLMDSVESYASNKPSVEAVATIVHEHMHFLQTILTGYGQTSWDMQRQLTSFLVGEWREVSEGAADGKRRLPLAHCASASPQHFGQAYVAFRTAKDMLELARARFFLRGNPTLRDLGVRLADHPWPANPQIQVGNGEHVLQTKEIIEGHAYFVEASLLESAGYSRAEAWPKQSLPRQYWIALTWFREQCGDDRYSEFPFLCDLALQTSNAHPVPATEREWQDSNPAWRFKYLVDALRKGGLPRLETPADWPTKYGAFASALLDACGFEPLDAVLEERAHALRRAPQQLGLEKLMDAALDFRRRVPWCGGNPVADTNLWQDLAARFQAPLLDVRGELRGDGLRNFGANSEIIMELQFQTLAAQVLGDFSDEAIANGAVECAFARFGISQGCEYQVSHGCAGRYRPDAGAPHPLWTDANGNLKGCSFEALLSTAGMKSEDLLVEHGAQFPTWAELTELEAELAAKKREPIPSPE
jgi:hypothetical protein